MKNVILISLSVIGVFLITRLITPYTGMHMMHNFYYYNNVVTYILAALVVIIVVTYLVNNKIGSSSPTKILDQRLAQGDISIEEYQRVKELIQRGNKK